MIVWLNGAFGVGKTTVALELVPLFRAAVSPIQNGSDTS